MESSICPRQLPGRSRRLPCDRPDQAVLAEINGKLYPALQSLDEERLARPLPGIEGRTAVDQLAGFAMHDTYHVGQLGYIRKGLGYSAVAG